MDQIKIGGFLKELRKGKNITQEQLAENFGVSGRTISRWETGANMPDLDVLIQVADYFDVDIREILDGERKSEDMNKDMESTLLQVADYYKDDKIRLVQKMHIFFWIGVIAAAFYVIIQCLGIEENSALANMGDFALGLSFGMLIIGVIYTSRYMSKIKSAKARLLGKRKQD